MSTDQRRRDLSYVVLCAGLVIAFVLFGVRANYSPGVYYAIAGVQLAIFSVAAWNLGASALQADAGERRRLAIAGTLLITPGVLFSFVPGIGPPGDQTPEENQLRYLILLINSMAIAGGLIVLRESLREAGEHFFATLGFAAIVVATPLYLIWGSLMLQDFRASADLIAGEVPPWIHWIRDLSDILLFFGGALTYMSAAAFAMSLAQIQWLGRNTTRAFVAASVVAVLCLVIRGIQFPNPTAMAWYAIPGFVFGIPAIPWIMPCVFGVVLLRRAGSEQRVNALSTAASG